MKKIFIIGIAALAMFGCKKNEESKILESVNKEVKTGKPVADAKKATMRIEGMTCAIGCAKTIQEKLNDQDGVQNATVDFDSKTATIEYDGTIQSIESLSKTIEGVADGKTYKVFDAKTL